MKERPKGKNNQKRALLLRVVETCTDFEKLVDGDWLGKCFYCRTKILVECTGRSIGTLEHILPRSKGGTNDLLNLAVSCRSCNNEKGVNADRDADAAYFVKLTHKRAKLWREHPP